MKTIYKYPLMLAGVQHVVMPHGASLMSVQVQNNSICLWAYIETDNHPKTRRVLIVGTGHEVPPHLKFVGTVQHGAYVWHIFDGGELA
jgi:hypothetical protein